MIIIIIFTYSSTLLKVCIKTLAVTILVQRMHTLSTVRDYFPKGGHSLQSYIDLNIRIHASKVQTVQK